MRKKLLFVLSSFEIGGTTVSTRGLVSVLNKNKYDIYVWVLNPNGILSQMYDGVPQIPTCFVAKSLALTGWKEESNWLRRFGAAAIRYAAKHSDAIRKTLFDFAIRECVNSNYDTIAACQEGMLTELVAQINCKNLVAWVRCDYHRYFSWINNKKELFYQKYNHVICVSEKTRQSFLDIYPYYSNKTHCIYNPQDSGLILSNADFNDNDNRFKANGKLIVSLGRLDKVKRFDKIPEIARKLSDSGLDFVWYIIGDGSEKKHISDNVLKYGVEDKVILLGAKSNPHFYIKRADLYVCLSLSEACPRVINEAKILETPVVSTDFPAVYEYLTDGENGLIADIDSIPDAIMKFFTDQYLNSKIKNEISKFSFDNSIILKQLDNIL